MRWLGAVIAVLNRVITYTRTDPSPFLWGTWAFEQVVLYDAPWHITHDDAIIGNPVGGVTYDIVLYDNVAAMLMII